MKTMGCIGIVASLLLVIMPNLVPVECWEREITSQLNPGCIDILCNGTFSVIYITAKGPNDTLHYVWDLTYKPSLLLALAPHTASLTVDWDKYKARSDCAITFSEKPKYMFGVVVNKIWEYNDVNDTGIFNQNNKSDSYVRVLHPEKFAWRKTQYENEDSRSVSLGVKSEKYIDGKTVRNGTVQIWLKGFGYMDHSKVLPHLLHTANTSQVDFVIDGLATDPDFSHSRFALELILAGSDQPASNIQILERKSLDDEHAPGVFTLVDVETPRSAASAQGGYLQWRPVAYVSPNRDISNSTEANVYNPRNVSHPSEDLHGTAVLSAFCFNGSVAAVPLVQAAAVSFGLKEDGFYHKTKYTAWTFTMGYGKPPDEDFSLLVILVISIGLGLPALLIAISGLVMLVRRVSRKKDDLFLGR